MARKKISVNNNLENRDKQKKKEILEKNTS